MIDLILRYMDPISSLMSEVKVSLVSVAISSVHPCHAPCLSHLDCLYHDHSSTTGTTAFTMLEHCSEYLHQLTLHTDQVRPEGV